MARLARENAKKEEEITGEGGEKAKKEEEITGEGGEKATKEQEIIGEGGDIEREEEMVLELCDDEEWEDVSDHSEDKSDPESNHNSSSRSLDSSSLSLLCGYTSDPSRDYERKPCEGCKRPISEKESEAHICCKQPKTST